MSYYVHRPIFLVLGAILCMSLVGWLAIPNRQASEPQYNGRGLKSWVEQSILRHLTNEEMTGEEALQWKSEEAVRVEEASKAVRHVGTNALPTFLEWVRIGAREHAILCKPIPQWRNKLLNWPFVGDWLSQDWERHLRRESDVAISFKCLAEQGLSILGSTATWLYLN